MMRHVLIAALAVVALAGCGRKDAHKQAEQQQQSSPFVEDKTSVPTEQQAPSSGGGSLASCPSSLPTRDVVAASIKSALNAIYGPDEAGAKVSVAALTPDGDCKTVTVAYKTSGTAASAPMSHDGDAWSITLYNKQYPVK